MSFRNSVRTENFPSPVLSVWSGKTWWLCFVSTSNKPFPSAHVLHFFSFLKIRVFTLPVQGITFSVLGGKSLSSCVLHRQLSHQLGETLRATLFPRQSQETLPLFIQMRSQAGFWFFAVLEKRNISKDGVLLWVCVVNALRKAWGEGCHLICLLV